MSQAPGWENLEPAPIEWMHGRMMDLFHEYRLSQTESTTVEIDGIALNNIIAAAKRETYEKYANLNLERVIEKDELTGCIAGKIGKNIIILSSGHMERDSIYRLLASEINASSTLGPAPLSPTPEDLPIPKKHPGLGYEFEIKAMKREGLLHTGFEKKPFQRSNNRYKNKRKHRR